MMVDLGKIMLNWIMHYMWAKGTGFKAKKLKRGTSSLIIIVLKAYFCISMISIRQSYVS